MGEEGKPDVRSRRKRFWEIMSGQRSVYDDVSITRAKVAVSEGDISKAEQLIREGILGKPESWLNARRKNLSDAWKKVNHSDLTLFCVKGKHERCDFDPDCKCHCHVK